MANRQVISIKFVRLEKEERWDAAGVVMEKQRTGYPVDVKATELVKQAVAIN